MAITYGISIDNDYTITNIAGGGDGGSSQTITVIMDSGLKEDVENVDWIADLLSGNDLYCQINGSGTILDERTFFVEDVSDVNEIEIALETNERPTQGASSGTVTFVRKPLNFNFNVSNFDVAFDFTNSDRINNQSPSLNPNENVLTKNGTVTYTAAAQNLGLYESTGSSGNFEYPETLSSQPMFTNDCTSFQMVVDIDVKVSTARAVFDNTDADNETNGMLISYTASSGTVAYKYSNNNVVVLNSSNTVTTGSTRVRIEITQTFDGTDTRTIILANGQEVVDDTQAAADERVDPANIADPTQFPASSSGSIYRFIGWKKTN